MKNRIIAELLEEMADLYELLSVEWKPRALRRAARNIETLKEDVAAILKQGGQKALMEIPGVGKGIAEKIEEYLKTRKIKEHQQLLKKVPKGVDKLMHIQGMGPKKAILLSKKLGIKTVKQLEQAAKAGKIQKLPGFGKKSEEEILGGTELHKKGKTRSLIGVALPAARQISDMLRKVQGVKRVELAGSLRRMRETIGDLDILAVSSQPEKAMEAFTKYKEVKKVLAKGKTKSTIILKDGMQSDLRVIDEKSFGAAWQYFTGNKDHNVALRQIAIKKDYKLNEYGLFKKEKYVCGRTEPEVYKKLGLAFIPPELRESSGEIDIAKKGKIPNLIELKDVKGDLHVHSTWSDGAHSILEMAQAAQSKGHKYIALTDHSKSERIANGMDEKRLQQYLKDIEKVQKKVKITILKGAEVDILADGSLDYDDKILKKLDFVAASIHSGFKSSEEKMTKRIMTGLENQLVNVFSHPTGRRIHLREPYKVNIKKLIETAKRNNVALEINSNPVRLDLNGILARKAVEAGVKIIINTDAHSIDHLDYMEYGVGQARRGWVQKKDVINALPLARLKKFLKK